MFTNQATGRFIILALLAGQIEPEKCEAWIPQVATSRLKESHLHGKSWPQHLQRRAALFQGIHMLIGASLLMPQSSAAYFDYTDEEIKVEEQSNEAIITPPPSPPEPKKKTTSKRRRFFERDDPPVVPPVVNDDAAIAPVISEPVVATPPVEQPPDPTTVPVPATSDVKCLTDCMYTCQQEESATDKIACLDNCPTRCLTESTPPQQQKDLGILEVEI